MHWKRFCSLRKKKVFQKWATGRVCLKPAKPYYKKPQPVVHCSRKQICTPMKGLHLVSGIPTFALGSKALTAWVVGTTSCCLKHWPATSLYMYWFMQMKLHQAMCLPQWLPESAVLFFATCKEFCSQCQNINAWTTICVLRSTIVTQLDGHLSQLLKAVLHDWFTTHALHLQGLQLHEPTGQAQPWPYKRLFANLGFFIMDGGAHKFALSMKGDAGSRFCSLCKNVFLAKVAMGKPDDEGDSPELTTVSSFTKHQDLSFNNRWWNLVFLGKNGPQIQHCYKQWLQKMGTGLWH